MKVTIELQNASSCESAPDPMSFHKWSYAALEKLELDRPFYEISIRLVDEAESANLNTQYRNKSWATNILSFPFGTDMVLPDDVSQPLGDLVICAPVIEHEAQQQKKSLEAHWAHLTVHGVLHLNGYDHEEQQQASTMEAMEINILAALGYSNPYEYTDI